MTLFKLSLTFVLLKNAKMFKNDWKLFSAYTPQEIVGGIPEDEVLISELLQDG